MNFPTVCVDNFFNDPDKVRNMALSLPFYKCGGEGVTGIWPGYRTEALHKVVPDYLQKFSEKIMKIFFNNHNDFTWTIETHFQRINSNFFNGIDSGWIHIDDNTVLAGVVYLNPIIDKNNGTSIFIPKDKNILPSLEKYFEYKKEMYTNFKNENAKLYEEMRKENNDLFEKTIEFYNIYNRLVAYDMHWHMENGFKMPKDEDRLTQVFFIKRLENVWSPIQCSKEIDL
jgi:hypothetical protein